MNFPERVQNQKMLLENSSHEQTPKKLSRKERAQHLERQQKREAYYQRQYERVANSQAFQEFEKRYAHFLIELQSALDYLQQLIQAGSSIRIEESGAHVLLAENNILLTPVLIGQNVENLSLEAVRMDILRFIEHHHAFMWIYVSIDLLTDTCTEPNFLYTLYGKIPDKLQQDRVVTGFDTLIDDLAKEAARLELSLR